MKLPIQTLAVAFALLSARVALATYSVWPQSPNMTVTAYEAAGCKAGRGIGARHRAVAVPTNKCIGFPMAKSYTAVTTTHPRGQTCVLTLFTGDGCQSSPDPNPVLDFFVSSKKYKHSKYSKPKTHCFDSHLPDGWLGSGSDDEPSWSVMYNCNMDGY